MVRVKVVFEHVDGETETHSMSPALAIATIERILEPGWPHLTAIIGGKRIKERDGNCSNAFLTSEHERIVVHRVARGLTQKEPPMLAGIRARR